MCYKYYNSNYPHEQTKDKDDKVKLPPNEIWLQGDHQKDMDYRAKDKDDRVKPTTKQPSPHNTDSRKQLGVGDCKHFLQGKCMNKYCKFSHRGKRQHCQFYTRGYCKNGNQCSFSHKLYNNLCIYLERNGKCNNPKCKYSHDLNPEVCESFMNGNCHQGNMCFYCHREANEDTYRRSKKERGQESHESGGRFQPIYSQYEDAPKTNWQPPAQSEPVPHENRRDESHAITKSHQSQRNSHNEEVRGRLQSQRYRQDEKARGRHQSQRYSQGEEARGRYSQNEVSYQPPTQTVTVPRMSRDDPHKDLFFGLTQQQIQAWHHQAKLYAEMLKRKDVHPPNGPIRNPPNKKDEKSPQMQKL